jgi:acetolactate decarboxylase
MGNYRNDLLRWSEMDYSKSKTRQSIFFLLISAYSSNADVPNAPRIVGAMKDVMWEGKLQGVINLDTISDKKHIYGLGPVEYLTGEVVIIDGVSYKSQVKADSTIQVTNTFKIKAPFFSYANIPKWRELELPDSISTLPGLERFLDEKTKTRSGPYLFKIEATVDSATFHIVNLPTGAKVSSPGDAHSGQRNFQIKNTAVQLIGFFSTQHQAIFTHHDTHIHIHLITEDLKQMGHLESIDFQKGKSKLFLPKP